MAQQLQPVGHGVWDFTQPWPRGDRIFVVEDKKVYANEAVLALSSPVFEAMFSDNFQEHGQAEIPLPGKSFDDFVKLMEVIHPPHKEIDCTSVHKLLPLAQEYMMVHVLANIENVLLTNIDVFKHLPLAKEYGMFRLYYGCMEHILTTPLNGLSSSHDPDDDDHTNMMFELLVLKVDFFETSGHVIQPSKAEAFLHEYHKDEVFLGNLAKVRTALPKKLFEICEPSDHDDYCRDPSKRLIKICSPEVWVNYDADPNPVIKICPRKYCDEEGNAHLQYEKLDKVLLYKVLTLKVDFYEKVCMRSSRNELRLSDDAKEFLQYKECSLLIGTRKLPKKLPLGFDVRG